MIRTLTAPTPPSPWLQDMLKQARSDQLGLKQTYRLPFDSQSTFFPCSWYFTTSMISNQTECWLELGIWLVFERAARSDIIVGQRARKLVFNQFEIKRWSAYAAVKNGHNMLVIYLFPLKCQQLTFSTLFTIFHQLFKIKWDFADFRLKIGKNI